MKIVNTLRKVKLTHPFLYFGMKILAKWEASRAFKYLPAPPLLIYQMGKVGSTSVYRSLKEAKLKNPIYKLHYLSADMQKHKEINKNAGFNPPAYHFFMSEALQKYTLRQENFPWKIISLVRDPIAIEISGFFQSPHLNKNKIDTLDRSISSDEFVLFFENHLKKMDWKYTNEWFDRELKSVFNVDVYDLPFNVEQGYSIYKKSNIEILILRLEDLSSIGSTVLSDFLDLAPPLPLISKNLRKNSKQADIYRKVISNLRIAPDLCRKIYSSKHMTHFYDSSMIENFTLKWSQN